MRNFRDIFGKESVLTALVSKKPVALSVGIINVDQRVVVESAFLVKDENENNGSTYKIHNTNNEDVSFCDQVEGYNTRSHLRLTILIEGE